VTVAVRLSRDSDAALILDVVEDAFGSAEHDANEEIDIVRSTWALCPPPRLLELVAHDGRNVVGHVMAAPGVLGAGATPGSGSDPNARARAVLGVAPLSVAPERQGVGIGSALMQAVIEHARARERPLLLLLGDPAYYERFGFEAAWPLGITYPPAGRHSPNFMARRLPGYDRSLRGEFRYCWEC
jgi:putative acetyltransferase